MKWPAHFGLNAVPFSKEVTDADLWVPSSRLRVVVVAFIVLAVILPMLQLGKLR